MGDNYGQRPFGLRDIKLTDITGSTQVDLPAAQKLGFKEKLVTGELRGDDRLVELLSQTDSLEFALEAGGISVEAWALMTGRTVNESGTTPTRISTYNISAGDCYPYFKIYGKAVGPDCAEDTHVLLYKCKLTAPLEGEFADGNFFVTSCSGMAVDDGTNGIADIVLNETAAALPAT